MVDVVRDRMEAEIDQWHDVLTEARQATRAVVVGNGPRAYVEMVPDYSTRLSAFREAMDRAYGRPKQTQELSGPDGQPVTVASAFDLSALSVQEKRDLLELIEKAAAREP